MAIQPYFDGDDDYMLIDEAMDDDDDSFSVFTVVNMIYDPSNNGILSKGSDVGDNHSFLLIPLIKFNLIMAQVMQHQQRFYYQSEFYN